ncbi:chemotaxis protein CheW [Balneolales bacterium ANBcel1]|nr:chemotaxis protein CheW [Balneolales bacterium ANBcel1]
MSDTVSTAVKETESKIQGGKFLTFFLGKEEYAIEILKVQEIIGLMPITPVPSMPMYIRGVLNLRGKIIPVMDLRSRFGFEAVEDTEETCIIVVQESRFRMGVVVDKVSEVADIDGAQIEEVPSFGANVSDDYLSGIGKVGESVKLLLDVSKVLFDFREVMEEQGEGGIDDPDAF